MKKRIHGYNLQVHGYSMHHTGKYKLKDFKRLLKPIWSSLLKMLWICDYVIPVNRFGYVFSLILTSLL